MNLRAVATPLTIASFLTISSTGTLMFLGVRGPLIGNIHEYAGIVFVAGSILHLVVNLKPAISHLKRPVGAVLAAVFAVVTIVAIFPAGGKGNNPRKGLMQAGEVVLGLDIQEISQVSHQSQEDIRGSLTRSGFVLTDARATLRDIAIANKREPLEAIGAAMAGVAIGRH